MAIARLRLRPFSHYFCSHVPQLRQELSTASKILNYTILTIPILNLTILTNNCHSPMIRYAARMQAQLITCVVVSSCVQLCSRAFLFATLCHFTRICLSRTNCTSSLDTGKFCWIYFFPAQVHRGIW